jgi:hypothetical protein
MFSDGAFRSQQLKLIMFLSFSLNSNAAGLKKAASLIGHETTELARSATGRYRRMPLSVLQGPIAERTGLTGVQKLYMTTGVL